MQVVEVLAHLVEEQLGLVVLEVAATGHQALEMVATVLLILVAVVAAVEHLLLQAVVAAQAAAVLSSSSI